MTYNYRESLKADIKNYVSYNYTEEELADKMQDRDEFYEELYDYLWVEDSVTGNASGSYTFSAWAAEENLCHNTDLLFEALEEFGYEGSLKDKGAEWCDVTIRCYLLSQVLSEVLDEYAKDMD